MLHKKSLIIVVLSTLFAVGCKDNVIDSPVSIIPEKRISKISADAENYQLYLYSDQKLVKYESVQNNLTATSISFRYQEDGKLESEEVIQSIPSEQRLYKYIYDSSGKVSQIDFSIKENDSFKKYGSFAFYYNQNNQLTKNVYTNNEQTLIQETQYSYYSDGNTKEKIRYVNGNLYDKSTFEYDDKKNPVDCIISIAYSDMAIYKNNIIKRTTTESSYNPKTSVAQYNFIYSEDGYPLKRVLQYSDCDNNNLQKTEEYKYN
jgi:hypothetical protein